MKKEMEERPRLSVIFIFGFMIGLVIVGIGMGTPSSDGGVISLLGIALVIVAYINFGYYEHDLKEWFEKNYKER